MSTIRLHQPTTSTPEQFVAGLTDFGPGRSELFGDGSDQVLGVHAWAPVRPTSRRARTASGNACTTTRPDPNHVELKTTDSNLWGGNRATPTIRAPA